LSHSKEHGTGYVPYISWLKGIYFCSQVGDENFEEFLKEVGVGFAARLVAKNIKPRLTISESGGKWTMRSEGAVKTITIEFVPGVEFDQTTPNGHEVKVCIVQIKIGSMPTFFVLSKSDYEMFESNGL
jgi:hypothetical protein